MGDFAGCASAADLWRILQFVLGALDDRRWRCGIRKFMTSPERLEAYGRRTGMFDERNNGALPKLTLTGTTRRGGRCIVLFRSKPVNKADARCIVSEFLPSGVDDDADDEATEGAPVSTEPKTASLLLVQPLASTPQATALLNEAFAVAHAFTFAMCRSDFMRNRMVPKHRAVTGAERQRVLAKVPASKLPRITQADPVVVYYGWKRNTLVEVTQALDVGPMVNYRLVVAGEKK